MSDKRHSLAHVQDLVDRGEQLRRESLELLADMHATIDAATCAQQRAMAVRGAQAGGWESPESGSTAGRPTPCPQLAPCVRPSGLGYFRNTLTSPADSAGRVPASSGLTPVVTTFRLPTPLVDAIRAHPDQAHHWMNLSKWLWFRGLEDEAVAVRVLWETLRDNVAQTSLHATLENLARDARILSVIARAIEQRASQSTVDG